MLGRADLVEANLRGANLTGAGLSEAKLIGADLGGADLIWTDLRDADMRGANLSDANLTGAKLGGADLTVANVGWTTFGDNDLSVVKGLETVDHEGPSTIGIDTIYRSKGKIPEVFLRGAGVSDGFITYMESLTGAALQFYSCFISYSHKDEDFAKRLHADLQDNGVRCWFAPEDIQVGKKIHEQIDQAIRVYDRLLIILSEHSMDSAWVSTEIANARQKELATKRRGLFPVGLVDFETIRQWKCFDADTGKDSAREIREYFIPDFSNWRSHDSYKKGFDRLLRDLKAKGST